MWLPSFAGRRRAFGTRFFLCCALLVGLTANADAAPPVVRTTFGSVSGTAVQTMNAYLGIPYAAPPVGALRWKPPQPPAPWTAIRPAVTFANHCPQGPSAFGFASLSEDCLYLNVFVPAGTPTHAKLPVMVWFHGGGFTDGESDDYDPDRLVARGVIVVTVNYRLGYLGFLATTGLDAEPHAHVNYGLLDQQSALRWTQANIAAFGGDPTRVTIFGQSAGGASVFAALISPGTTGLFSRAIIQSGAYDLLSLPTLANAEAQGAAVAGALGCAAQDTTCLRNASVTAILTLEATAGTPLSGGPSPAIDGSVIPVAPDLALATGAYHRVPVMQGTNHDEFRLFTALLYDLSGGALTAAEYPVVVGASLATVGLSAHTAEVLAQYPLANYASPDLAYSALTTDAVFSTPAFVSDVLLSARGPLYAYEFSDAGAPEDFLPPVSFAYGAAHGSELQYVYDSFDRVAPPLSPAQTRLASTMVGYWTSFARSADPNGGGAPHWFRYDGFFDDVQSLVAPQPHVFFSFVPDHKALFWTVLSLSGGASNATRSGGARYLTLDGAKAAARTVRAHARTF
jgi:para-nitrobenzyl esterase